MTDTVAAPADDLIALDTIAKERFGLSPAVARRHAALGKLSINAFRLSNNRRGPMFVRRSDLENLIASRAKRVI
jgi:hypothetical protein